MHALRSLANESRRSCRAAVAVLLALLLAVAGTLPFLGGVAPAWAITDNGDGTSTHTFDDGSTVTFPNEWVVGETITLSGTGMVIKEASQDAMMVDPDFIGSAIGLKLDGGGISVPDGTDITNPVSGSPLTNKTIWDAVLADNAGEWSIDLAWPTTENSTLTTDWQAGEEHSIQLLTASIWRWGLDDMGQDGTTINPDVSRSVAMPVTIVAAEAADVAPAVTTQPQSVTAAKGEEVTFTAAASGSPEPTVKWQRSQAFGTSDNYTGSWVDIADATDTTLTVNAGTSPHLNNRLYRAVFTNDAGEVTTDPAKLTVVAAPSVTTHPAGQTISVGETATFTAEATSTVEQTVKWQSTTPGTDGEPNDAGWSDVAGATEATLTVAGTDADAQHGTFYRAVFTNASGSTNSNAAQLRFTEKLNTEESTTVTGESYGPDGTETNTFSISAPNAIVRGENIVIEGTGYVHPDGEQGSVAMFMIDASYSGDPMTLNTTREITHPVTGEVFSDKRGHALVQANADGTFRAEIPWPNETSTTKDAAFFEENWQAGSQHIVRILTGSQLDGDYQRGITVRFTVVDEATQPEPSEQGSIALSNTEVEQYGDIWFNLSDFTEGTEVKVELQDAEGNAVVSKPYTIGADGNTANPDGQTYRKLTVPRDATPGSEYRVVVLATEGDAQLASSENVTVTEATTRVFNPGDHAAGEEDLTVQQGGSWTFHAVGFAPNGNLTATTEIAGETVTLSGEGQAADSQQWQLDGNGDTGRSDYTRVHLPEDATAGELEITFSDGTNTVTRTITVEAAPVEAAVTVAESAEVGGMLHVTGTGWFTADGTEGSTVAIKLDDGAFSHLDTSVHQNKTIWYVVEADTNGEFDIEMPLPNGTTEDAAGSYGSDPAFGAGEYSLRLLTGSLKEGDVSRSVESDTFTVTAPEVTPEPTETVTPEPTETETPEPTETETPEPTETVTPEPTTDAIELSQSEVVVGGSVTVTVTGVPEGEEVAFALHSDPIDLGTATADASGTAKLTFEVTAAMTVGEHTVVATLADGSELTVPLKITDAAQTPVPSATDTPSASAAPSASADQTSPADKGGNKGDSLANTGASIEIGIAATALLLVLSGALVLVARRRSNAG